MQTKEETLDTSLNDASSLATMYSDMLDECTLYIYASTLLLSQLDFKAVAYYLKRMSSIVGMK